MKNRLWLFIIVALLQLAAPLYMAWHWENILQTGQRFLWTTAPVDPYDPFKGRYIDLQFNATIGPLLDTENLTYGQTAYAVISADSEGKAIIQSISSRPPTHENYVKVTVNYVEDGRAHVRLPFKRYYMPEEMAPAAEIAYRDNSAGKTGLAAIRIKDGYGVIEQLYIAGQPLAEYLRQGSH